MTPIERVKERIKFAMNNMHDPFLIGQEILRELDGMVLVPIEPIDAQLNGDFSELDMDDYCAKITYKAMIAPYLPKGDE